MKRDLVYRRSSQCSTGACVEVATDGEHVFVRDSKNLGQEPLAYTSRQWRDFIAGVRAGDFD